MEHKDQQIKIGVPPRSSAANPFCFFAWCAAPQSQPQLSLHQI